MVAKALGLTTPTRFQKPIKKKAGSSKHNAAKAAAFIAKQKKKRSRK